MSEENQRDSVKTENGTSERRVSKHFRNAGRLTRKHLSSIGRAISSHFFWIIGAGLLYGIYRVGNTILLVFARNYGIPSGMFVAWYAIVLSLGIFAISLLVFGAVRYEKGSFLRKGEIRDSIAVGLTALYIILLPLSLVQDPSLNFTGKFLENFWLVYVTVIGFYFASHTAEQWIDLRKTLRARSEEKSPGA